MGDSIRIRVSQWLSELAERLEATTSEAAFPDPLSRCGRRSRRSVSPDGLSMARRETKRLDEAA